MSVKYSKVIVEDITSEGLSDDELSLLVDVFCRTVVKVKSIQASQAEFPLNKLATTKTTSLAGFTLSIMLTFHEGCELWLGQLQGQNRNLLITGTID
ncbi:hypothetical protein MO867_02225 [Microbulbifer sp. OS29]|uniref:Uncharacterized protein n=1 Tax=Microbulbifer okhotskensis TaxID=2926617 RepID=A0A9X2J3L1_9GAMM|nr:hypothetical protein [Microbulbifer okhotskensis]MCO1333148.1 hypothetical protein [Microbulbifer okhotskensis]